MTGVRAWQAGELPNSLGGCEPGEDASDGEIDAYADEKENIFRRLLPTGARRQQ